MCQNRSVYQGRGRRGGLSARGCVERIRLGSHDPRGGGDLWQSGYSFQQCRDHGQWGDNAMVTEEDVWDLTLASNLKGVFLKCKYGTPTLRGASGGPLLIPHLSLV